MATETAYCPGCGKPQTAKVDAMKMSFQCSKCKTKWTLTFDTGEEGQFKAFLHAEDYED